MKQHQNIILTGFMGSGKSTIGKVLSSQMNYPLLDTDALIVDYTNTPIDKLFKKHGEEHFRALETQAIQQMLDQNLQGHIISTGGGLPIKPENQTILRTLGYRVWLKVSPSTVIERTEHTSHRPLLQRENPKSFIQKLLLEREPIYEKNADLIISADGLDIDEIVYGIIQSFNINFNNY